ncbi:MAG: molybdopterin-dependent oxidoreductase [Proteobacteria bacterium]|nr:molybdopterin-dependent oxidoreductase [Pseudomonadota bacterium]
MDKIVRTVCQGCHSECGALVHIHEGKATTIKPDPNHPSSRGCICVKGIHYAQFAYHPDRLRYPLKREGKKGEGKWQRISWDEALDEIAAALTKVKEKYGKRSMGVFHGTAPRQSLFSCRLLASALGTPNVVSTDLHICFAPSMVAEIATVGHTVTQEVGPDYVSSKCVLVCGGNPLVSHPPRGRDLLEGVKNNGAKLIVVDPRRTPLAAQADMWFQIRPGTDVALILGMLHTIISEELYDKAFVGQYCHGFDELKEHIKAFPPEKSAEITWLSAAQIKEAARLFARTKPGTVHHRVAVEHNLNSTQTDRALVILAALTGNLGVKGGNLLPTHVPGYINTGGVVGFCKLPRETAEGRLGSDQFPLISGPDPLFLFVHPALAARAMLHGKPYPLKALFLAGGNPVVNMQDTRRTWKAFKSLELFVVADFFMTPTAELADYVLPATTWLERDECCDEQYMNCIAARQKAVEPLYESRDDVQMVIDLVRRIPWADRKYLPWKSVDEFNDFRVRGMGMTFEEFKNKGYVPLDPEYKPYEKKGFSTPTGKVEIHSTIFEKHGYDPLPVYVEPPHSPVSTPRLLKDYPYILITGARSMEYYHSSGRQIEPLRKRMPDPEIEVHPETARRENLEEGDWVWVETPQIKGERVRFKVKFTSNIDPRVVHAPHGWWFPEKPAPDHGCFESNIDVVLSDDPPRERICGSVATRGTLCRIYK